MESKSDSKKKTSLTLLLPAGRLAGELVKRVSELAGQYAFKMYLSTAQNLRLYDLNPEAVETVRASLAEAGADFKAPGKFPLPKVCIGKVDCNLGIVDTLALSDRILARLGKRKKVKPKFKIAIAGCPASCSDAFLNDIGIVATRSGFDVYVGGKGGPKPKIGHRILEGIDEKKLLDTIEKLVEFHDANTPKKQRFAKLVHDPEFPCPPVA